MSLILNKDKISVGERIRRLRVEKDMTQIELANKIGTSKQNISRYEKGIIENIPIRKLEQLATVLGVTYEYLTTGYDRISDVVVYYDEFGNAFADERSPLQELIVLLQTVSPDRYDLIKRILSLPPERLDALAMLLGIQS